LSFLFQVSFPDPWALKDKEQDMKSKSMHNMTIDLKLWKEFSYTTPKNKQELYIPWRLGSSS
jgi:hypothetical protein